MKKTLVIGLDGASPYPLYTYAKQGYLKNIQQLMITGAYGELESTIPPATCPAWVTSVTGVNPGKHGISDFVLDVDLKTRKFLYANSKQRKSKAIWNILSEENKKVIVINVPVTYPPEEVNGIMVSGLFTPNLKSKFTYPEHIRESLYDYNYKIDIGESIIRRSKIRYNNINKEMEDLINLIEKRVMVCENLMNNYSWDFFMVVFTALDRLQHYYWKYIDKNHIGYDNEESRILFPSILKVYQKIDEAIGRLSRIKEKSIGDGNIIIYSDHGFKPLNAYFFTNSFFRQNELIKIRKKSFNSIINQHYIVNKIPYYLIKLLQNFPLRIRRKVTNYIQPTKDYIDIFSLPSSTKALHFGNGFIKINLDKESQEYEDIRSLIMNFFNNEFQNGELIKAYKREEIYSGIC
ncbi:MAG: alkaline phosphatase family protein, partial [Candidatus Hodarchaeales archaeon]